MKFKANIWIQKKEISYYGETIILVIIPKLNWDDLDVCVKMCIILKLTFSLFFKFIFGHDIKTQNSHSEIDIFVLDAS